MHCYECMQTMSGDWRSNSYLTEIRRYKIWESVQSQEKKKLGEGGILARENLG